MLQPVRVRTWAPRGATPMQMVATAHHRRLGVIGATVLSSQQRHLSFYFQITAESIRAPVIIQFLRELHRQRRGKVIVIWDRLNAHRTAARWFQTHHPDWFEFEWLPPYSPELNPVEMCWSHTKCHDLKNYCPDDLQQLEGEVCHSLSEKHNNQPLLRATFAHAGLTLPNQHSKSRAQ